MDKMFPRVEITLMENIKETYAKAMNNSPNVTSYQMWGKPSNVP